MEEWAVFIGDFCWRKSSQSQRAVAKCAGKKVLARPLGPLSHAHEVLKHELIERLVIAVGDKPLGFVFVEAARLFQQE